MKLLLCLTVILLIGLSQGRSVNEGLHDQVIRRITRQTNDMYIVQLEALVLQQCEINNHTDLQHDVEESLLDMKKCFKSKRIFYTTKEEYISHIEQCSEDVIRNIKMCLNDKQKYYPDVLLDTAKSVIGFLYDNFDSLSEFGKCTRNMDEYSAKVKYHQCLLAVARDTHDTDIVPENKDDFCRSFTEALRCFPGKELCNSTESLRKFTTGLIDAFKTPCEYKG